LTLLTIILFYYKVNCFLLFFIDKLSNIHKTMKKLIFLIILLLLLTHAGFGEDNLFSINLNWQLGIRCGYEYNFNNILGLKADAGVGIPGIIMADVFFTTRIFTNNPHWQFIICSGIPNILMPIGTLAFMVSPGLSVLIRRKISERLNIDLRIGEGFPLFFEKGKKIIRDVDLPLGLWPDLNVGVSFKV